MRLNGSMPNGATLNGSGIQLPRIVVLGPGQTPPEPTPSPTQVPVEYKVSAQAFVWSLRVVAGGQDVSPWLVGSVEVDREEGAAGLARFALYIAASVTPSDWVGLPVTIDYQDDVATSRRFTGQIATPSWDPRQRILTCDCSDMRQKRVEAMSLEQIADLVQGEWSTDMFEPAEGRSRWDYAEERLSTRPASLDCAPDGSLRVTSWYAAKGPHVTFGNGSTLDQSISIDLPDLDNLINAVEIEFSYRFARRWQKNQAYDWTHPDTEGLGGIQGWCLLATKPSTELPTRDEVIGALSSTGQTLLGSSQFRPLPPTGSGVYCDPQFGFINNFYPNVLLGFGVVGGKRWVQDVTEKYRLRVESPVSIQRSGEQVSRESLGFAVESERADAWESTPFGAAAPRQVISLSVGDGGELGTGYDSVGVGGSGTIAAADDGSPGHFDDDDDARRQSAGRCLLQIAQTRIIASHRSTSVGFGAPTSLCADIDLIHTVRLDDQGVNAQGKVRQILDTFDLASGRAVTRIALAIMRGGELNTEIPPLLLPQPDNSPANTHSGGVGIGASLPTQIGGRPDSPPHDPGKAGVSINMASPAAGSEIYPRQVAFIAAEIPASQRDELIVDIPAPTTVSSELDGGIAPLSGIPPPPTDTPPDGSEEQLEYLPTIYLVSIPDDLLEL